MRRLFTRVANIVLHPDREWQAIAQERRGAWQVFKRYLLPLTAIAPLAYHGGILARVGLPEDAIFREAFVQFLILSPLTNWLVSILGIYAIGAVIYLLAPFFGGQRDLSRAFIVAVYATTPVWLTCLVLIAPIARFPLLGTVILIGAMHSCYLFYLGVHHVMRVPLNQAAEFTGIALLGSTLLTTILSYAAGAAGLLPLI